MKTDRRNIIELLRRWLAGDAGAPEEARLQRSAEADDFLRDALDGFHRFPEGRHDEAAARLRERLGRRTRRRGGGIIPYLPRVAAAALALLAIAAALWFAGRPEKRMADASLSVTEKEAAEEALPAPLAEETESDPAGNAFAGREKAAESRPDAVEAPRAGAPQAPPEKPGKAPDRSPAPSEKAIAPMPESEGLAAAAEQASTQRLSRMKATAAAPVADTAVLLVNGRVTDAQGSPLEGAEVILPGTSTEAVTGTDGSFSIAAPVQQKDFVVNQRGFVPSLVPIGRQGSYNVILAQDTGRMENGISAVEAPAAALRRMDDEYVPLPPGIMVTPEGGLERFQDYLRQNIKYPKMARRKHTEGIVLLQLTVHPDGSLSGFEVLHTPGDGLEKEAIRLLREGPKWILQEGERPVTIKYPVVFSLD